MLQSFLITIAQMGRILFFLLAGFLFNHYKLIPRSAETVLSRFTTLLFMPALTLYSNIVECRIDSIGTYGSLVFYGAAFCLAAMGLAMLLAKRFGRGDPDDTSVFRYALTFPNTGAVGTPLILAFFGTAGLFQYNLFLLVTNVMILAWGVPGLLAARDKLTLRKLLKYVFNLNFNMMILGMGLGLLGAGTWLPEISLTTMRDLGNCYVPVALLMTGFTIADYDFSDVFGDKRVYLYTLLRLVVIPLVFCGILLAFDAPLLVATMVGLTYACPCGMNVVVYPAAYGKNCKLGASMVCMTSVGSIVTVPLMYALIQHFFA